MVRTQHLRAQRDRLVEEPGGALGIAGARHVLREREKARRQVRMALAEQLAAHGEPLLGEEGAEGGERARDARVGLAVHDPVHAERLAQERLRLPELPPPPESPAEVVQALGDPRVLLAEGLAADRERAAVQRLGLLERPLALEQDREVVEAGRELRVLGTGQRLAHLDRLALQRLGPPVVLFQDGFEGGDLAAWDNAVP